MFPRARLLLAGLATVTAGLLVSGCSEGGFGESVVLAPEKRASLLDDFAAGRPLVLPADAPFNLIDSQRVASGRGGAESAADSAGTARCAATAEGVGDAVAEFQLGHVFDHRGQTPLDVTVQVDVDYACQLRGDPADTSKPEDSLGLRVFVRDSDQRILKSITLTETGTRTTPERWSARQGPAFDVTLQPGLAYYVVLAGRTAVTGTEHSSADGRIEVKALKIELIPRP